MFGLVNRVLGVSGLVGSFEVIRSRKQKRRPQCQVHDSLYTPVSTLHPMRGLFSTLPGVS